MNIYEINASWYDGGEDSGHITVYYVNEPTMEEISDHIRMPRILEDRMDMMLSEMVEKINDNDHDENKYRLSIDESDMHFSISMTIGNVLDNSRGDDECDECDMEDVNIEDQ